MCCAQKSLKSSQNRRLTPENALFLHEKTKIWGLYTKKSEVLASNLSYLFFIQKLVYVILEVCFLACNHNSSSLQSIAKILRLFI